MREIKVFFLLALFMLAFGMFSEVPAAGNPPEYEEAKAMLQRLQSGKGGAAEWERCSALFRKAWQENPRWPVRTAAMYRAAAALEGKARVTRAAADARKARALYEQMAGSFPRSPLADDALYRAAVVSRELLGDAASARRHIGIIAKSYPGSDHAKAAAEYGKKLGLPSSLGKAAAGKHPPSEGKKASHHPSRKDGAAAGPPKALPGKKARREQGKRIRPYLGQGHGSLASQLGLSVRSIVLDAGHGGKDPGTMHFGVIEREVTLDVVRRMEKLLRRKGYAVHLSRHNDGWISLSDRVRFGRKVKGDLFVSIHVNACDNPLVSGMETYVLDFARTSAVSRLALAENADSGRLGDMDRVLTEILVGARTSESRRLASCIQRRSVESLKSKGTPVIDGGVKGAPFFVLVGASMPSVLVEIGYCTNEAEANRLKLPGQRQLLAEGIVDGILAYAGNPDGSRGKDPGLRKKEGASGKPEASSDTNKGQEGKRTPPVPAAKTGGRHAASGAAAVSPAHGGKKGVLRQAGRKGSGKGAGAAGVPSRKASPQPAHRGDIPKSRPAGSAASGRK